MCVLASGTIDPSGIVAAYAKASTKLGAKIFEGTPLAAIDTEDYTTAGGAASRRITGVTTTNGARIKTGIVVNACGSWYVSLSVCAVLFFQGVGR